MRRKKIGTVVLSAILAAGMAMSSPIAVYAEERDEVGDILDSIFGGDKPKYDPDGEFKDAPIYWDGGVSDGSEWDNLIKDPAPEPAPSKPEPPKEEPKDEVGEILDSIFGGNKPEYNPDGEYKDAPTYDGGHIVTDGSEINWGPKPVPSEPSEPSEPAPAKPEASKEEPTYNGGHTVTDSYSSSLSSSGSANNGVNIPVIPGNDETVTNPAVPDSGNSNGAIVAGGNVVVPVTDEALLTVFPGAMQVATPEGFFFFDALKADYSEFQVWFNGGLCNAFSIVNAKGHVVKMNTAAFVEGADGKSYVNVTIDPKTKGAAVAVTEMQASAFTRICGIDGVMVNGVLVREFQDTVRP